jgi:hypothetical protein
VNGRAASVAWGLACALSACATPNLAARDQEQIAAVVRDVRGDAYPELARADITLSTFSSDDAFFESNFSVPSALLGDRKYTIAVNPRLFEAAVPADALPGVVAHELAHTLDYERRDRPGLVALVPVLLFDDDTARFERWTDLQAVARGYGPSLLRYREWQRGVLTPEQWQRKLLLYYGPQELALLIDVRGRCPHAFYTLLADPPRTTRDIVTHCP